MGIFHKVKKWFTRDFSVEELRGLAIDEPKAWNTGLWNIYGNDTPAGENVNEHTALSYSAVFNAISLISGTVGALPLHLVRRQGKTTSHAIDNSLYDLLHTTPNPYMTAMTFRECMMAHMLAWGNGYAEIVRNGKGETVALWPITPDRISPRMEDGVMYYEITVDGERKVLPRERILHIPGLGFDGYVGYSVVQMARNSIGLGKAMERFGSNYFGQGTHPGIIVSHPGKLSETAHKNIENSLSSTYSGLGKSHRLMLVEDGMRLEKIGIPPNDSQFLESRQFQIPEVARWFNLPPHKLKDLTKSSFSNIESEQISFVVDSLLPWGIRLEQAYNMQLLSKDERSRGLYFKHIFEGLLRGNSKDRAEFYKAMFNIGAITINEIREKEDLDPVEGGNVHLVPLNMTTLDKAGQAKEELPEAEPETEADNDQVRKNLTVLGRQRNLS